VKLHREFQRLLNVVVKIVLRSLAAGEVGHQADQVDDGLLDVDGELVLEEELYLLDNVINEGARIFILLFF